MLDIGWQELLVIGALALIVVGPKDLPGLLRTLGQWVGRIRGMAREFQRTMNDAARETDMGNFKELSDFKRQLESKTFDTDTPAKSSTGKVTKADPLAEFEAAKVKPEDDTDDPGALAEDDTPKTGPVTRTAPVDKPDPAAMGNAMPVTDGGDTPEAARKPADT